MKFAIYSIAGVYLSLCGLKSAGACEQLFATRDLSHLGQERRSMVEGVFAEADAYTNTLQMLLGFSLKEVAPFGDTGFTDVLKPFLFEVRKGTPIDQVTAQLPIEAKLLASLKKAREREWMIVGFRQNMRSIVQQHEFAAIRNSPEQYAQLEKMARHYNFIRLGSQSSPTWLLDRHLESQGYRYDEATSDWKFTDEHAGVIR